MNIMKQLLFVLLLGCPMFAQSLPDAPEPQPKPASFFTFRKSWEDPALKPNKKSWAIFLVAHGVMFAAMTYDIRHTHGARESWGSEVPAMAGLMGMDIVAFKFFSPAMSIGGPIYATQHYLRDSTR